MPSARPTTERPEHIQAIIAAVRRQQLEESRNISMETDNSWRRHFIGQGLSTSEHNSPTDSKAIKLYRRLLKFILVPILPRQPIAKAPLVSLHRPTRTFLCLVGSLAHFDWPVKRVSATAAIQGKSPVHKLSKVQDCTVAGYKKRHGIATMPFLTGYRAY